MWLFYLVCLAFCFCLIFAFLCTALFGRSGCAFIYSIVFVYAIAARVFIQSIIRFYHWAAYHLWNVFFRRWPRCALPFSTMLLVARNLDGRVIKAIFLHKFLNTLAMCFLAPVAEEIIFRGFLLNSSIGWGRYSRVSGIIITSLAFAIMHTQYLFAVTFVYLFVFHRYYALFE